MTQFLRVGPALVPADVRIHHVELVQFDGQPAKALRLFARGEIVLDGERVIRQTEVTIVRPIRAIGDKPCAACPL